MQLYSELRVLPPGGCLRGSAEMVLASLSCR
jgi:hypothetical protein